MTALVVTLSLIASPFLLLYILYLFACIAEYLENPVIELVEELRKKHSNTNENYQPSLKGTHHVQLERTRRDHPEDTSYGPN